jgi:hypothetical protein
MARTLVQWREAILAWHTTGYTNGPVEGLNSLRRPHHERLGTPAFIIVHRATGIDVLDDSLYNVVDAASPKTTRRHGEH